MSNFSTSHLMALTLFVAAPVAWAQTGGGRGLAPTTPGSNQPLAPLAPGVNSGVRPSAEPAPTAPPTGPVVDGGSNERTSHCSEARAPTDTSPPCTVVVKPAVTTGAESPAPTP